MSYKRNFGMLRPSFGVSIIARVRGLDLISGCCKLNFGGKLAVVNIWGLYRVNSESPQTMINS